MAGALSVIPALSEIFSAKMWRPSCVGGVPSVSVRSISCARLRHRASAFSPQALLAPSCAHSTVNEWRGRGLKMHSGCCNASSWMSSYTRSGGV